MLVSLSAFLSIAVFVSDAADFFAFASPLTPRATTLKAAAGTRYFAAALGEGHLTNASDPKFAQFAKAQFSGATPENEMKW